MAGQIPKCPNHARRLEGFPRRWNALPCQQRKKPTAPAFAKAPQGRHCQFVFANQGSPSIDHLINIFRLRMGKPGSAPRLDQRISAPLCPIIADQGVAPPGQTDRRDGWLAGGAHHAGQPRIKRPAQMMPCALFWLGIAQHQPAECRNWFVVKHVS